MELWIIIAIWLLLGLHSCWFFIKRFTYYCDFTVGQIHVLVLCLLLPIVTHIATLLTFKRPGQGEKILFHKK